jgi:hypothetical protein
MDKLGRGRRELSNMLYLNRYDRFVRVACAVDLGLLEAKKDKYVNLLIL